VADGRSASSQVERWVSFATTIVAPATLLSALLFYFGYVSSRSQYEYFGVDVDTIGLSTQDYVMRSPQPLLVPLLVLALGSAGLLALHTWIRGRVASAVAAGTEDENPTTYAESTQHLEKTSRMVRGSVALGLAVLGAGVVLLFTYGYVRDWAFYDLVTPLLLAVGAALIGYASRVRNLLDRLQAEHARAGPNTEPVSTTLAYAKGSLLLRRAAGVLICVVIAACIFWATATVAQWSGRGLAQYDARHLSRLPSVILDTKERLFLRSPGIEETILPASEGQTFHYRYRRLRLLIQGHDRMFLVPDKWSASNSTLVIPLDGTVRVQFQFQNQHP